MPFQPRSRFVILALPALASLLAMGACKGNGNALPGSGVTSSGGPGGTPGSSGSPGMASSSGASSGSGDAAADGAVARLPPVCDPSARWGSGAAVPGVAAGAKSLGAITPDEKTIAWMDSDSVAGPIHIADRTDVSLPFGTPQTIAGPFAPSHVSITGDGLTVVVVMTTGNTGFGEVRRTSRTTPFAATADTTAFSMMFREGTQDPMAPPGPAPTVADPVISADGFFLYFTQISPAEPDGATLAEAYRTTPGAPWTRPRFPLDPALRPSGANLRRPTGISSDLRALFYWDETDNQAHVAYRDGVFNAPDNLFSSFAALGALRNVAPGANCDRLYFSSGAPSALAVSGKQ